MCESVKFVVWERVRTRSSLIDILEYSFCLFISCWYSRNDFWDEL